MRLGGCGKVLAQPLCARLADMQRGTDARRRRGSRRPGRAGTVARSGLRGGSRLDARGTQDLPDGGWRDGHTEFRRFTVDPAISHSGSSFARRTTRRAMLGTVSGRPGLRRLLVSYLLAATLRCLVSSVAGVTAKTLGPAAAGYEPGQRGEPYPVGRLVTHSAGLAAQHRILVPEYQQLSVLRQAVRDTRTAKPSIRRTSRQTILSSIRSANHDLVESAGDSAGQPLNRVFERHRSGRRQASSCTKIPPQLCPASTHGPAAVLVITDSKSRTWRARTPR